MNDRSRFLILHIGAVCCAQILLTAWLIHMKFEPAWLAVMLLVSLTGCFLHIKGILRDPDYLLKLGGIKDERKGRIPQLDHLRVIAVCGVILTHVIQVDIESYRPPMLYAANILWVLTMACNAIYVMLSGALLYRWREESLRVFYARRIITIGVPLVVYYLWYTAVNYHLGRGWDWVSIKSVPHWILANEMREAPHFWLIYVILSIYVTVPLFRHLFRHVSYKDLTKALTAVFLFTVLSNVLLPYAQLAVTLPISGWLLVSFAGYWVCLEKTRRYDRFLIMIGITAGIGICLFAALRPETEVLNAYCLNDRPLVIAFCVGLFAFVFYCRRWFSKDFVLIRCMSKYAYGMILIHWWALHFVVRARFSISSMSFHYLGTPLSLVLILMISWVFCFIVDNLLVLPVRKLLEKIFVR